MSLCHKLKFYNLYIFVADVVDLHPLIVWEKKIYPVTLYTIYKFKTILLFPITLQKKEV